MPRTDEMMAETGAYMRVCAYGPCERTFRTDNPRTKYCSEDHKKAAANDRYYARHKKAIIKRIVRKRKAGGNA